MAHSKFTLHKYIKLDDGSWRYKRAAFYANGKIKPNVVIVGKDAKGKPIEEMHAEGKYVMNHNGSWLDAGTDALEAQRRRSALLDQEELKRLRGIDSAPTPLATGRLTLAAAAEKYFANCSGEETKGVVFVAKQSQMIYHLQPNDTWINNGICDHQRAHQLRT